MAPYFKPESVHDVARVEADDQQKRRGHVAVSLVRLHDEASVQHDPANQTRPQLAHELQVKRTEAGVELATHEEVVHPIACETRSLVSGHIQCSSYSARLGAKKIGHNLARKRPKFGHNPACERSQIRAQFCGRSMKTWAQICKHCTVHQLSENTKTEIIYYVKRKIQILAGRYINWAGRKTVRAGRSTLGNMPRVSTSRTSVSSGG